MRGGYSWILILIFGWSIAGGVATFLTTQFGFPITWITPLTVAMMGAVLFLVYRGYSMHGWIVAGCIGLILISGVAFARALTVPEPDIPAAYLAEFEANANSNSVPFNYDPNYYIYYDRYQRWQNSRRVIDTPLWIVLVVGDVIAAGVSVYLWHVGDLTAGGSSGLRMVIRRLSGAQRLGVEVHDLAKFRDQTDAEQGVFVGRVVAQSPAGRSGLRTGDVLIELAGKPINSPGAVNRLAKGIKKGMAVDAVVIRHDARVELRIRF